MRTGLLAVLLFMASLPALAREVADVRIDETAQVGGQALLLNGAGVRTRIIFDIYVAALYLPQQSRQADEVLADARARRMALHVLYSMSSGKLMDAFKAAIEANHSTAELAALDASLQKFYAIFREIPSVNKGDVIRLDYVPDIGTRVSVNGMERGMVAGAAMNRALMRIWLGGHPVQEDLKKALLGG